MNFSQEKTHEVPILGKKAVDYVKVNHKNLVQKFANIAIFLPEKSPVSVFMAGSPGAGKTEVSCELVALIEAKSNQKILRIDPDEYREIFEGYTGNNAWIFQEAVTLLVNKILDFAFKKHQSFLLDGTFTNENKARDNIQRALKRNREVQICYVYQDPILAWGFVKDREEIEGRRIEKSVFIDQYFAARDVVNQMKKEFGSQIQIDLLLKNHDNSVRTYEDNIMKIDTYVSEKYNKQDLAQLLLV